MTKAVRVENADSGTGFQLDVEVWDQSTDGKPDVLVKTVPLDYPTAMTASDCYVTSTRYLVVRERRLT